MKIVFVINCLYGGGAERVLSLVANKLVKRGYEITIITYLSDSVYELDKSIKHISIFTNSDMKRTNIFDKLIRRVLFYIRIINVLKKEKPNVIISFLSGMNIKMIPIAKLLKIKIIVSEHNNYKVKKDLFSWVVRRWLYRLADAVTVLTLYDYNNYYKKFLHNVVVMPNPVTFKSIDKEIQRDFTILVAGSLDRWRHKGFDNLLVIFSKIVKKYSKWKLKIAGNGDMGMQYLKNMAKELNIEDNIIFLGFVNNISDEFKKASIFVLTSRYEGFPMVLIEAMSQGCACISYNCISGPSEIINDGIDGIIVENQNQQKMIEAIEKVIEDDKLRNKLSSNAKLNIKRFSMDRIADKWIDLLENTVD